MKFSTGALVLAAGTAYAQIDVMNSTIYKVVDSIEALNNATNSFNGTLSSITSKADALIDVFKSSTTTVRNSKALTVTDAIGLSTSIQSQSKKVQELATTLKAQRPAIEKVNGCKTINTKLDSINTNSLALIDAIVSKVPSEAQTIARQIGGRMTGVFNEAQYDFSGANCKDSGPSSTLTGVSSTTLPTSASSTSTGNSNSGNNGGSTTPVGAIVGSVVGGVGGIAIVCLSAFLILRRQKAQQKKDNAIELDAQNDDGDDSKSKSDALKDKHAELCGETTVIHEAPQTPIHEAPESAAIYEAPENARHELE